MFCRTFVSPVKQLVAFTQPKPHSISRAPSKPSGEQTFFERDCERAIVHDVMRLMFRKSCDRSVDCSDHTFLCQRQFGNKSLNFASAISFAVFETADAVFID
jgi:hypothetical protein